MASAFRRETVNIPALELCAGCPDRGSLECAATQAQDTWARTDFFSLSETESSGEMFAGRVYSDASGGETEIFLNKDEAAVRDCPGPDTVKRHVFRSNELACHVNKAVRDEIVRRRQLRNR